MTRIELGAGLGCLRTWVPGDASSIARHANNRSIWLNLRDAFPHPYSIDDAACYITTSLKDHPPTGLAIAVGEEAVGSIGVMLHPDVERVSAELGYWLAEPFWGRGITTAAVRAMTGYAFATFPLTRVYAVPFASNCASTRVLEKAGYRLEGHMQRAAIKNGHVVDQLLYAVTDEEWRRQAAPGKMRLA